MGIKAHGLFVALSTVALLGAGCIGQDSPVDSSTAGGGLMGGANETTMYALNFTGSLVAPNPTNPDPTGMGVLPDAGQEGTHYNVHAFDLNATTSHIKITLSWPSQSTPAAAVPDLDMFLYDPEGADLSGAAGASSGAGEVIELDGPFAAGSYSLRVNLFAGAAVDYEVAIEVTEGGAPATAEAAA